MRLSFSAGRGEGITGRLVATGFGLFFALMGLMFVQQSWQGFREARAMQAWTRTPCMIVSSSMEDAGEDFRLLISYRYTVDGTAYTGSRYGEQERFTTESIEEIQQTLKRLSEGKQVDCYFNPDHPEQSVLVLPAPGTAGLAMVFSMLFPAFGLLFAALPWLGRRKKDSITRETKPQSGRTGVILFGLIFSIAGLAMLKPITIDPLTKTHDAKRWLSTPAIVISSKVKSHSSDNGTTYSVYIAYRYTVDGESYVGDRYTFVGGSSSGYDSKAAIVSQYPVGREFNVFVNPDDPSASVIRRDASLSLLFCLFPFPFILVGLIILITGIRNRQPAVDRTQSQQQIVQLKGSSPAGKAFGLLVFTLVWNSIVFFMFRSSDIPRWFASLFGIAGLAMTAATIHALLAIFNPRPTVEITPGDIRPGTVVAMRWRLAGRVDRIGTMAIGIRCQQVDTETHRSGGKSETRIVKTPLYDGELKRTDSQAEIAMGTLQFTVPEELPPSRPGNHQGIQWHVLFHGDIARWPDMKTELPFTVYSRD